MSAVLPLIKVCGCTKNIWLFNKCSIIFWKILFYFKEPANYEFSYAVKDDESGNDFGHQEARQGDVAEGKYYVLLPDGRLQTVEYTADTEGYKPKVTYEQVGGGYPSGRPNGGYQYWF